MRTTIDAAGRVVVPREIRRALGLDPGTELEIVERDGEVVIGRPAPDFRVVAHPDGGLVLSAEPAAGPLSSDLVRDVLERTRR